MYMQYQNADHTMSLLDETHLIRDLEIGSSVGASSWWRVGEKTNNVDDGTSNGQEYNRCDFSCRYEREVKAGRFM